MIRELAAPCAGIVLCSMLIGLAFNAARGRNHIEIGRAYFADGIAADPGQDRELPVGPVLPPVPMLPRVDPALAERAAAEFLILDGQRVRALFEASRRMPGDVLFVDARDDGHYRAGHVPGALQLDYYNLRADIEPVLPWLPYVPWIVVYCESGECEDGHLLCRALRDEYAIPDERILLYLGGMQEWRQLDLPLARGDGL